MASNVGVDPRGSSGRASSRSSRIRPRAAANDGTVRRSDRISRAGSARTMTSSALNVPSLSSCAIRVSICWRRRASSASVCSTSFRRRTSMLRNSDGSDLRAKDVAHLVEIEAEFLEHQDPVQLGELLDGVVAIAGLFVRVRRHEQTELIVEPQQARRDPRDAREVTDPEHASPDSAPWSRRRAARGAWPRPSRRDA